MIPIKELMGMEKNSYKNKLEVRSGILVKKLKIFIMDIFLIE